MPSKELKSRIERRAGGPPDASVERASIGRREVLKDAQERVEWEKWESSRRKEEEDKAEAERIAFAEIDWQDFQVASTIEFTESDEAGLAELPPPMSLSEVENMTLAQKKMNSIFIDGGEGEGEENGHEEQEMEMDAEDSDEEAEAEKRAEDKVEVATLDANLPVKIRKDYVRSTSLFLTQYYTSLIADYGRNLQTRRTRKDRLTQCSKVNKCQSKSSANTFDTNYSTLDGRKRRNKPNSIDLHQTCFPEVRFKLLPFLSRFMH